MQISYEEFETLVQQLQQKSFAEAKEAFGAKGFERWRNPQYHQPLKSPDCSARIKGGCGDTMEIQLKFRNNRVAEAAYITDGCASSSLCGSFTAELAHGRTPEELLEIEPSDVLSAIGTFPEKDTHCATLSTFTLHEAVNDYMLKQVQKNN